MKRSEAIKKLMSKVISPFEVIKQEYYESGLYEERAKRLLEFIETELKMLPPDTTGGCYCSTFGSCPKCVTSYYDSNQWEKE